MPEVAALIGGGRNPAGVALGVAGGTGANLRRREKTARGQGRRTAGDRRREEGRGACPWPVAREPGGRVPRLAAE